MVPTTEEYEDHAPGLLILRATIDELSSQVQHLEHSQVELQDALEETPDDEDFLLALRENEEVIRMKKDRIAELHEQLYTLDIAFRQEKASEQRGLVLVPQPPPHSQQQQPSGPPAQSSSSIIAGAVVQSTAEPPAAGDGLYL
jgi:hypothetical protein